MNNEFVMFVGPMFGGKTTKLLSAVDRYKYQGREIHTFKPDVDERYSNEEIVTHWGGKVKAVRIPYGLKIHEVLFDGVLPERKNIVIAVDEAFMIRGIADTLIDLFRKGHTILVSSLQLSANAEPYEEIVKMLPHATKVEVCPAVCSQCDRDAHYTTKVGGRSDHEIEVGGADIYQPRCFKHFYGETLIDENR
jgi:thymidine kinase